VSNEDRIVPQAAELVASYWDLKAAQSWELKAHICIRRFLTKFAEAAGLAKTGLFLQLPMVRGTGFMQLPINILVQRIDDQTQVILTEDGRGIEKADYREQLRKRLKRGDHGLLDSWRAWTNPYLLGRVQSDVAWYLSDALWPLAQAGSGDVARWAWAAIDWEESHDAGLRSAWSGRAPADHSYHVRHWPGEANRELEADTLRPLRAEAILQAAKDLNVRVPPQFIPLDALRSRTDGIPLGERKRKAPTVGQQACFWLVAAKDGLHMTEEEAREALGMDDWRQVRSTVAACRKKLARLGRNRAKSR